MPPLKVSLPGVLIFSSPEFQNYKIKKNSRNRCRKGGNGLAGLALQFFCQKLFGHSKNNNKYNQRHNKGLYDFQQNIWSLRVRHLPVNFLAIVSLTAVLTLLLVCHKSVPKREKKPYKPDWYIFQANFTISAEYFTG